MPAQKRTPTKPFKDFLDAEAVGKLAGLLKDADPDFLDAPFTKTALEGLFELELKARVDHISAALAVYLNPDFPAASRHIRSALPPPNPTTEGVTDSGFFIWPLCKYVEDHGRAHFDDAMATMKALTSRWSCEFAIRPYLLEQPEATFAVLHAWTADPDPHVRRLCSEGTRPLLPWGVRLQPFVVDPSLTLALIEKLKDDPSLYVRRSLANHLNDVAKHHPEVVVQTCARWAKGATKERQWLIRHALRTLIKRGDPGALAVLGYGPAKLAEVRFSAAPTSLKIGEKAQFSVFLRGDSDSDQPLIVDYAVHFQKKRGTSPKVFKWSNRTLPGRAPLQLNKNHAFRDVSIRKHRPGPHRIELIVNGAVVAEAVVELEEQP